MILKIILTILLLSFLMGCSNNSKKSGSLEESDTPESLYIEGMRNFDNEKYEQAISIFQNIEKIYPLSNEAIQSQIMSGFIDYVTLDYDKKFIQIS